MSMSLFSVLKLVKLAKGVRSLLDTLFEALPQVCLSCYASFSFNPRYLFLQGLIHRGARNWPFLYEGENGTGNTLFLEYYVLSPPQPAADQERHIRWRPRARDENVSVRIKNKLALWTLFSLRIWWQPLPTSSPKSPAQPPRSSP